MRFWVGASKSFSEQGAIVAGAMLSFLPLLFLRKPARLCWMRAPVPAPAAYASWQGFQV